MRIAFYAPLKAPDRGAPSGDRRIANLLIKALMHGGHEVRLASRFRSRESKGNEKHQRRLRMRGEARAQRLVKWYGANGADVRPELWFTYHLYYKAPDWIGPIVAAALDIPYVVAEASHAPKRDQRPWQMVHRSVEHSIGEAHAVVALNSDDVPCLLPVVADPNRLHRLAPFIEDSMPERSGESHRSSAQSGNARRSRFARTHGLDVNIPWLVTVAMMRTGDKLESYVQLAEALTLLKGEPWNLLVLGDGEARGEVEAHLLPLAERVAFLGARSPDEVLAVLAHCDLYVWPAVNEAFGMAFLEAQSVGLPVIACATRGVPDVVADGVSGHLVPPGDMVAFAGAVRIALREPTKRVAMGRAARQRVYERHGITGASRKLDDVLNAAVVAHQTPGTA
jgi:glycosyltransferase involved in cell wall biosynthesis